MKQILFSLLMLFVCSLSAQELTISSQRPEKGVIIQEIEPEKKDVWVLTKNGAFEGVMVTSRYRVIYDQHERIEGEVFNGESIFTIESQQVKPIAYRIKLQIIRFESGASTTPFFETLPFYIKQN